MARREGDDKVTLTGVTLGEDSKSGEAVHVLIDGEWHWIPYSQVSQLIRTKTKGTDSITVSGWLARKNEWAE